MSKAAGKTEAIYLDHFATTPCDPRVLEVMLPLFCKYFGNAHSPHALGRAAGEAIEEARAQVADLIGGRAEEVIFTSGATEANNLTILGLARWADAHGIERRKIVTSEVEHKAVLGPCRALEAEGWELQVLGVDRSGRIDLAQAARAIDEDTLLVSLQAANNEIGTLQPVREAARLAHESGALFHCDAAQAVGKTEVDVEAWEVDFLSLSGHKMYGPKGAGALWARGGRRAPLLPLWHGGAQEHGLRPGTLPVPLLAGLGAACALASQEMEGDATRLGLLRDALEREVVAGLGGVTINGAVGERLPHGSSLTFSGVEADALLANLPRLALSSGSACDSGALSPSRVLLALGLSRAQAASTIRLALGRFTSEAQVLVAARLIIAAVRRLRDLN